MEFRQFSLAVATALLIATPAAAQQPLPAKAEKPEQAEVEQPGQLTEPEAPVQMAERADATPAAAPKRPRAARVTTCRCGDPSSQQ